MFVMGCDEALRYFSEAPDTRIISAHLADSAAMKLWNSFGVFDTGTKPNPLKRA
jgi:hypothetical protein